MNYPATKHEQVSPEFVQLALPFAEAARCRQVLGYLAGPIPFRPQRRWQSCTRIVHVLKSWLHSTRPQVGG